MSSPLLPNNMTIPAQEIDRLTAGLSPEELAELGLIDEDEAAGMALSRSELDTLLGGAPLAGAAPDLMPATAPDLLDRSAAAGPAPGQSRPPTSPQAPSQPASAVSGTPSPDVRPVQFASLVDESAGQARQNIDLLLDVELKLTAELGQARLTIREILQLGTGSIVELNRLAGEPVDITINNTLIARGEVVVVDEKFGIRVLDVVSPAKRVASML